MLTESMIGGAIKSFFSARVPKIAKYFNRSEDDVRKFIENAPGMYEDAKGLGMGLLNRFGITKDELLHAKNKLGHRASEIPIVGGMVEDTFNRAINHVSDPQYTKNREQRRAEAKKSDRPKYKKNF